LRERIGRAFVSEDGRRLAELARREEGGRRAWGASYADVSKVREKEESREG